MSKILGDLAEVKKGIYQILVGPFIESEKGHLLEWKGALFKSLTDTCQRKGGLFSMYKKGAIFP